MERVRKETKEVSLLDQMELAIQINEDDLDSALLEQPQLYWQISRELALSASRRDAAKQYLAVVEARTDLNIRRRVREKDESTTEKEVKSEVTMHLDVEKAAKVVLDLNHEHAQWQAIERAFDQRMNVLKKLVDLYLKNYWSESGLSGSQDSMKSHNANLARREMSEARRRRSS